MDYKSTRELWKKRVSAYQNSGMKQMQWCKENDVKLSTLRYWIRKLSDTTETSEGTEWYKLDVKEVTPVPADNRSITVKVGGYSIAVGENFSRSVFIDVVRALNELC